MTTLQEISLSDYLDEDNPWTPRLLGKDPFQQTRDAQQVEREYDQDFYGARLRSYLEDPEAFEPTRAFGQTREITASVGERLFRMPHAAYVGLKRGAFIELLDRFEVEGPLCELGAGNGQNHFWLRAAQPREVYGGEYSKNAVELAGHLGLDISLFDFYEPADYDLIRDGSTVFTMHAIEQIPDAACILEGLRSKRDRIERVIHFEPGYRETRTDLLGRLRNRYLEINDYNRNLLSLLAESPDVEIEHLEEDAFGNNPLNPATIVVWRFS